MIAEEIKRLRECRRMSVAELGRLLRVPVFAVERWEAGDEEPPAESVAALSELFGVTTDSLLGREGESLDMSALTPEERGILRRLADYFGKRGK